MRWRGWAIALILLAVLPAGCARRLPQETAQRYLEDLRAADYTSAYSLLCAADRSARTLPEFLTEIPLAPDVSPIWFGPVLRQTQYVRIEVEHPRLVAAPQYDMVEFGYLERNTHANLLPLAATLPAPAARSGQARIRPLSTA